MSLKKADFKDLPDWLQQLWELKPELARKAENYIDELKDGMAISNEKNK